MSCCQCLVRQVLLPSDTAEVRRRKELWVPIAAVLTGVAFGVFTFFTIVWGEINFKRSGFIGVWLAVLCTTTGLVYPLVTKRVSVKLVGTVCVGLCTGVLFMDLSDSARAATWRSWAWVVLVMDLLLALNVPRSYQRVVLVMVTVHFVVTKVESAFRLGLYDIDGFTENAGYARSRSDCPDPPCAEGAVSVLVELPAALVILFGDFFATRGFAEGLRSEQDKMLSAIDVSEQVAGSLAGFDLQKAEQALVAAGGTLPPRLAAGFGRLLDNLASYRPYLPQSCFEDHSDGGSSGGSSCLQVMPTMLTHSSGKVASSGNDGFCFIADTVASLASQGSGLGATVRSMDTSKSGGSTAAGSARELMNTGGERATSRQPSRAEMAHGGPAGGAAARRPTRAGHAIQVRRVTLLHRNISGFLATLSDPEALGQWLAQEVGRFADTVKDQRGMADMLSGDHFSASFGAVKAQGTQRAAAVRACRLLAAGQPGEEGHPALRQTAAVCSGRALCGDFGSAILQRFMVIGGVSSFVVAAERSAAAWKAETLIDSAVYADAEQHWNCRLRKLVCFPKFSPAPTGLWDVLADRMGQVRTDEWMYELQEAAPNPWKAYNAAVQLWCDKGSAEALPVVEQLLAGQRDLGESGNVLGDFEALSNAIQAGEQPPLGPITAAELAGLPAPTAPSVRC